MWFVDLHNCRIGALFFLGYSRATLCKRATSTRYTLTFSHLKDLFILLSQVNRSNITPTYVEGTITYDSFMRTLYAGNFARNAGPNVSIR